MPVDAQLCLADVLEASLPVVAAREAAGQWGSAVGIGVSSSFNGFGSGHSRAAAVNSSSDSSARSTMDRNTLSMDKVVRNGNIEHQQEWLRIVGEFGKIIRSTSPTPSSTVFL